MNQLSRTQAIDILCNHPYLYGHAVGFDKLTPMHNDWIRMMIFGDEDETLQGHRGSYKTTCLSIAFAVIVICYPNDRTLFMRKTDEDVKEIIRQTMRILEQPISQELCRAIWGVGLTFVKKSVSDFTTNLCADMRGTSQLTGMGCGGSITGKHFDRVFTDDIVNVKDRVSRSERERIKIVYQELKNVINRGGRRFNTGTPWHKDDAFSIMPNPKKYDCYSTGLISDAELAEIKDGMLPSLFAANYELRHIASEDVIFTNPVTGGDPAMLQQANYVHIDAAYGGEDYTAFTIVKRTGGKTYVFGKLWRKHVDDVLGEIIGYRQAFNAGKIRCETNADKGYLGKSLRAKGERVVTYAESMNKFLKITTYLRMDWRNIVFVDGTDHEYIQQICDYNEHAEHDDAPDSLASVLREMWGKQDDHRYQPLWSL